MTDPTKIEIRKFVTPFKRQNVQLSAIKHENGLNLLEIRIREQRRFTMLELDHELAEQIGQDLLDWAKQNKET